jgi:hypothetical protein
MSEPDQILAQQANQSIALMQAIGQNTQRAFENRFRVQAAQMATGIQVAGQIEEYRMNDARLAELSQTMRIRDQEFQWKKVDQAFTEKIRPLEFQMKQFDFQNKFRAQAEQRMSPFLTDIKGEFQQLIMDRPDLAADAQAIYAKTIDSVVNKTLSDPNADITTELELNKGELRKWINKNKTVLGEDRPKIGGMLGAGIDAANKLLGTTFDPLSIVKSKEKSAPLSKDQSSRAASIYSTTFGGVPQDFLRKHDPLFSSSTDSSYRIMMATGQLTSQEDYNNLTIEQQAAVASRIEKKQKGTLMKDTLEEMQKEIDNYVDNNAKSGGAYSKLLDRLREERNNLQKVYQKEILGIDIPSETDIPRSATIEANATRVYGSATSGDLSATASAARVAGFREGEIPDDAQLATYNRVQKQLRPYWMVEWLGGTQNAEKLKSLVESDKLNKNEVAKLIDKSSEQDIAALVMSEGFDSFIKESGLVDPTSTEGVSSPTPIGEAIDTLKSSKTTQSQKKEALKVLKYQMPDIIMRYTTQ